MSYSPPVRRRCPTWLPVSCQYYYCLQRIDRGDYYGRGWGTPSFQNGRWPSWRPGLDLASRCGPAVWTVRSGKGVRPSASVDWAPRAGDQWCFCCTSMQHVHVSGLWSLLRFGGAIVRSGPYFVLCCTYFVLYHVLPLSLQYPRCGAIDSAPTATTSPPWTMARHVDATLPRAS
jgi:hypothetical protein